MHWKLFATLAETAGEREVAVDPGPEATVADALSALIDGHPDLEGAILEDGEIRDHIRALHNGQPIERGAGLETPIESDDELALFPPVSGG